MAWSGSPAERRMRWWGWGEAQASAPLAPAAQHLLAQELGPLPRPRPPVALEQVRLPAPALASGALERLRALAGADAVRGDHLDRVLHAAGKGYPDLVRIRAGEPEGAPDAVAYPRTREQLAEVLALCAAESVAVVPFGGGTSVVGGLSPLRGAHEAVLSLDLARLSPTPVLDRDSRTVRVGAGTAVRALEGWLRAQGLTLGHFPQSFEYVSIGGCAATRSSGQASSGYGGIDRMVLGIGLCAPGGELSLSDVPASAAGPDLRRVLVGSEGTLGVISDLSLRVREAPARRLYASALFESFGAGVQGIRSLAQDGVLPALVRLSDEAETRTSLALAGGGALRRRLPEAYLRLRGRPHGALAILGFEGSALEVAEQRARAMRALRRAGAITLGSAPGRAWVATRFNAPYLRDELLTLGVMAETLETAARWSALIGLRERVAAAIERALAAAGTPGLVMCHVSHVYETGPSLYFTVLARQQRGAELEQWRALKQAAAEAIRAGEGTITHHHAVGRDHAQWLESEIGAEGVELLWALKERLDPAGIMNPGKLLAARP